MPHPSLAHAVADLERHRRLVRVEQEIDSDLDLAAVQRRLYAAGAPAVLFERVRGTTLPCLANLFGTLDRCRFLFRDTYDRVRLMVRLKADPASAIKAPWRFASAPFLGLTALPRRVRSGPCLALQTTISELPQIRSWPLDGGPFVTLPQVFTRTPGERSLLKSNLGMYRIQMAGNSYLSNAEVGLHFQLHRGVGIHYARARDRQESLPVSIFVGGPPAHTLAAVMPLPEGLSELLFAGMLAGRRFRYARLGDHIISTDADVTILGRLTPGRTKPEGPFGDHLGYYARQHEFPVLDVEGVYRRADAIWPFTVVGRPPQEDTSFGQMIHELTEPMVPVSLPGVRAIHAVDAAGVHPLLLAVGYERYVPYEPRRPRELLTVANAILGFGQASLAKYLLIAAHEDDPHLDLRDVAGILRHVLERVDLSRDLHFHTCTTMDTLDYSGEALNEGSKLVIAAAGQVRRNLGTSVPTSLPESVRSAKVALPGVLVVESLAFGSSDADGLARAFERVTERESFPLVVLVDDAAFAASTLANFLWVTFTRSNPARDVHGAGAVTRHKHWSCEAPMLIDARIKPHHAPPLEEPPELVARVEALAAPNGPLHGLY